MPRTATIRDVARLAEVSLGTISNYLNENKPIAEPTRRRIVEAINQLNFVPNSAVRVMQGGRSHVLAFIVPDSGNPFFSEVARGIEDVAVSRGHVVVSCNTEGDEDRERHYAKALSEMRARAAIVIASTTTDRLLAGLERSGVRTVVLGPRLSSSEFPTVAVDDSHGGRLAMQHVLDLGHRQVAFLGGPGAGPQIHERVAGGHAALAERGIPSECLVRIDAESHHLVDRSAAARAMLELTKRPTAVVCANDVIAIALESEALRAGLRIPDDIAIVGYDDIEGAAAAPVPITTIRQPQYELGRVAAEAAFSTDPARDPQVFSPELIVRASTVSPAPRITA